MRALYPSPVPPDVPASSDGLPCWSNPTPLIHGDSNGFSFSVALSVWRNKGVICSSFCAMINNNIPNNDLPGDPCKKVHNFSEQLFFLIRLSSFYSTLKTTPTFP